MKKMRSIHALLLAGLLAGCVGAPKYGEEKPLSLTNGTHPIWAVAPAVNLSGESSVDPILQADLVFEQLQAVNNLTVIPVNRVIQVYAALHITRVESEEQAAIVCEQLGCDALVIPTMTIYDAYNPPKMGAALQLLSRGNFTRAANVDARELIRQAAPTQIQALPAHPNFIQAVGMYDAANGTVRDAVLRYAKGRNDPTGPLAANQYFVCMDDYSGFVYHTLIEQLLARVEGDNTPPPMESAQSEQSAQTASLGFSPQSN